ncbi:MAG: protein kinase [Deltaproteobacteria bacterium]|nr:protein kinase [Deltaproteobacteria bacterium]
MTSELPSRLCPLCELRTDEAVCPTDKVPTVRADLAGDVVGDAALGRVIGDRYMIDTLIGEGASGRVYAARDQRSGERVALKLLQPHHARDRVQVRRFYREARAAMRLVGDHVVRVLDFGVDDASATPYIAMELLAGETLKERLARDGPLPPAIARVIARQVALALVHAAREGIVHRDLKPANILVVSGPADDPAAPRVKVTDFGVAKELGRADGDTLTAEGAAVGTPAYMAPEQVGGGDVGPSADLYALGCVLFELLAGRPPFAGGARAELYVDHLLTPAPALPDPLPTGGAAPPDLARLVARLLDKDPARRPADAAEVARALEGATAGDEPTPSSAGRRPLRRALTLALAAALVAGGVITAATLGRAPEPITPALASVVPLADRREVPATRMIDQLLVRGGAATIRLHQGDPRPPVITGDARLVSQEIEGARLTLAIGLSSTGAAGLVIDLWSPAWRGIKVTGAATLRSAGPLDVADASINIAGSARAELEVRGPSLTTSIRGSSDVVLRGAVARHEARTGGAARLEAGGLATEETSLTASGTSEATLDARLRLEVRNEGTGEIRYLGAPADLTTEGAGIVPLGGGQAP